MGNKKRSHEFDTAAFVNRLLRARTEEEQREIILRMSVQDALLYDADFEAWAHRSQLPPPSEGWRVWLMMAGRGFGKTRAGAEWVYRIGNARAGARIALIGATIADARSIMVEGTSGLLKVAELHGRRLNWEPSIGRLRWPNGSEAQLFSGDNADGLRGPEHDFAWADELAKWREAEEAWVNLQMGLRRGSRPRALVTTTPRPMELLKRIDADPWTVTTRGRMSDNINLDEKTIEVLTATYGGTRVGRQELDGELLQDVEGALWTREVIARARVTPILPGTRMGTTSDSAVMEGAISQMTGPLRQPFGLPPPRTGQEMDRIVVGVDPPAGVGEGSDACGIVVAGSIGETLCVLEDATVRSLSPEGWANRVAAAAARWGASLVVAEANNGGAMVESVLKAADLGLKVRLVHASRGKCARAEPIALKFESGKAFLAGEFPELDPEQWLTSCDDDSLALGANLALLGQELLQFGEAMPLGGGRFRLKRFLRARFGTEWAMGSHGIGETFVLFDAASLVAFRVPALLKGATVTATGGQASATVALNCESLRPPSPVNLVASFDANGELIASWTRRSRAGWYWLDEIDAPLGEQFERYGVEISGSAGTFETECDAPKVTIASGDLAGLGGGPATLTVRQIGDWAASHPTQIGITLP